MLKKTMKWIVKLGPEGRARWRGVCYWMLLIFGIPITCAIILMENHPLWVKVLTGMIPPIIILMIFGLWKLFFVIVPANKAAILAHRLKQEENVLPTKFSGHRETKHQRELQAGMHPKSIFEEIDGDLIDLTRIIPIIKRDVRYPLKSGQLVIVSWQIQISPLPGYLVNFRKIKEENIIDLVTGRVEAFLQGYFGSQIIATFDQDTLTDIKTKFELLFGGPRQLDEEEKTAGIWTGTPQILSIQLTSEVAEAQATKDKLKAYAESALEISKITGLDKPEEVARVLATILTTQAYGDNGVPILGALGDLMNNKGGNGKGKGGKTT